MKNKLNSILHCFYWFSNIILLFITYGWILPANGTQLITDTLAGQCPIEFLITYLVLLVIPPTFIAIGWINFRQKPQQLIRLFYGAELPLFLLCLFRLFGLRELTPASSFVLGILFVGIAAFLAEMIWGYAEGNRFFSWVEMTSHSILISLSYYVRFVLILYAIPVAFLMAFTFIDFGFARNVYSTPFYFNSPLLLVMGWLLTKLYIQSSRRILVAHTLQYGRKRTIFGFITVLTAAVIFLLFSYQQQPQIEAFNLLQPNHGKSVSVQSHQQELLAKSEDIRAGLLNAYLYPYRYIGLNNDFLWNLLMFPFLYNGSNSDEVSVARYSYFNFFDRPIEKAEKATIVRAIQSTANRNGVAEKLRDLDQVDVWKNVWLHSQAVTIQPQGDWADIEIHEVYENQTVNQQEISYTFSLPESAVITGVWLGETEDKSKRFPFIVSPRRAAEKVYQAEVQRRLDPALVEQIGPSKYRLRVYPIPPQLQPWEQQNSLKRATQMHLWLTYKVMQQEEGWALPKLEEKSNIYWNGETKRIRNGQDIKLAENKWLEAFLPASKPMQTQEHQVNLAEGYRVSAKPLTAQDYVLPKGKRLAVILDTSRSMVSHTKAVTETFNWLKEHGFADNVFDNNDADLYLSATLDAQPSRIDDIGKFNSEKMMFYGVIDFKEMLQQFLKLQGNTRYDGILLVTDTDSYDLYDDGGHLVRTNSGLYELVFEDSKAISVMPLAPLWIVHLGGLPDTFDDKIWKLIQHSGGGLSATLPEVMQQMGTQAALGSSVVNVVDGYAWFVEKASGEVTNSKNFQPLAARQLILGLSREMDLSQLSALDRLHEIAKNYKIVTPYSSMIVLVNEQQRQALKQAETESDRFGYLVQNSNNSLSQPNSSPQSFNPPSISLNLGGGFFNQANKGKQAEGKQYISSINKAQQAYYTENGKFTDSWEELGVGIRTETAIYKYVIRVTERAAFSFAIPKNPAVKAYIGGVGLVSPLQGGDFTSQVVVCEATFGQNILQAPRILANEVVCGAGTQTLR
jgi:putative PEP-CTERM system integral membrane protein